MKTVQYFDYVRGWEMSKIQQSESLLMAQRHFDELSCFPMIFTLRYPKNVNTSINL